MIEVFLEKKDSPDILLRKYTKKLSKIGFNKKNRRTFFEKPSERRKKEVMKARLKQRYLQKEGLV